MSSRTDLSTIAGAALVLCPQKLAAIHDPSHSVAVWQRGSLPSSCNLARLTETFPTLRTAGSKEEVALAINHHFANLNAPELGSDVLMLLELFQEILPSATMQVYMARVESDMCRRYHADYNILRLLCTYEGPGTLWLPDQAVDYKQLGPKGDPQRVVLDPAMVQQTSPGDVILLKGALYPAEETKAAIHRSPSIEESGQARLLLRIDAGSPLDLLV